MSRHRLAATAALMCTAGAVGLLGTIDASAATGPNLALSMAGNFPTTVNSSGNFSVTWTNVGTVDISGTTTFTVDLPAGLTTSGALVYSTPYDYTFTESVSPDGRHLSATYAGKIVPGRSSFMKVLVASSAAAPSGVITAAVANASDVNTADNTASVTLGPSPSPTSTSSPRPTLTPTQSPVAPATSRVTRSPFQPPRHH